MSLRVTGTPMVLNRETRNPQIFLISLMSKANAYKFFLLVFLSVFLSSCATAPPSVQPQVKNLVASEHYTHASKTLRDHAASYGSRNQLLYFLDQGMVYHFAGKYQDSIPVFEKAKQKFEKLYTQSLTQNAASWFWNDYALPYRGEDFERVMINIFQAINYAAIGDFPEALVEARDVDSILTAINADYRQDQKNVYKEDAFARFLMGLLYEASGGRVDLNDAFISYTKAVEIYENDKNDYAFDTPRLLKENLLAVAEFMGREELDKYRRKFGGIHYASLKERREKAEVYVIHYQGMSPMKIQDSFVVPLPGGYMTRFAFPKYHQRVNTFQTMDFYAKSDGNQVFADSTELGEDIERIAVKNLENRKVREMFKAVARPAAKYALERAVDKKIREKDGEDRLLSKLFRLGSSFYNTYSEIADLRSWQTLPAQIRISRLILQPGRYEFSLDGKTLGSAEVKAGEKKFLAVRTTQ